MLPCCRQKWYIPFVPFFTSVNGIPLLGAEVPFNFSRFLTPNILYMAHTGLFIPSRGSIFSSPICPHRCGFLTVPCRLEPYPTQTELPFWDIHFIRMFPCSPSGKCFLSLIWLKPMPQCGEAFTAWPRHPLTCWLPSSCTLSPSFCMHLILPYSYGFFVAGELFLQDPIQNPLKAFPAYMSLLSKILQTPNEQGLSQAPTIILGMYLNPGKPLVHIFELFIQHFMCCRLPGTVTATANCQFPFSSLQSRHATGHLSPLSSSRCINICFRIEFQDISSLWCLHFQIYLSQPLPGYLMLPWCLESQSWFLFLVLEEQIFGKVATYLGKCSKYPW